MQSFTRLFALVSLAACVIAHEDHDHDTQLPLDYVRFPYQAAYPGDNEVTADSIFSGITTFARLPWVQCLGKDKDVSFDVAFLGAPFDTGTSYRPGARFGPAGIRAGSRRLTLYGGYNVPLEVNPFRSGLKIVDCGDIPVTPYDNKFAIKQIEDGHKALLHRPAFSPLGNDSLTGQPLQPLSLDGRSHPRIITLGGDHTIVLPLLRSIYSVYGAISVIHFDSHLDTWKPQVFGGAPSDQAAINHGTYFYWASQEGLIKNGLTPLTPHSRPATGTPETGGWSTRELREILRGLDGLHIVSADIVEVAPAYDTNAELTTMAAADVLYEVLSVMAKTPLGKVSA
ncbi:hypothetical protein EVJ58_g4135 [Rhodofomes roseus]|uniref:Agmatinase n=1 Tax=Rhodofomes roseus TaxID=34475 RepID=A0A4Y9YJM3_9APHY|nr:hypothetical protein EVJ58_g4135 [Rhodofomes roseus]